jgi:serine/threonine-protein kinase
MGIPDVGADRLAAALSDRYRIERELGAGGMATVYLAADLKHDRKVAIKVLKPELAAVLGAERFIVEIKTTAALQHPHILPLFDSGETDGFLYYVMPYIEGETIREKLNRETQFAVDEAVRITREVADALDYAHRHGVIHRDIKPENILLHDGRAMVMDFGIALAVSAAAGGRMTETGLSLGTPHYMSPEQATAEKEISGRSDVYSLASVLYEMLAGQPPHIGGSAQQIIMKIIAEPVAAVTTLRKSVPPNVSAALTKALEKLPADRFENAKAFGDALANPSFASNATVASGAPSFRGRVRGINGALVALSGLLAIALVWQSTSHRAGAGPTAYDVALPDSAPLNMLPPGDNFAVAPSGDFLVYVRGGQRELWYRSLLDATVRRLAATEGASRPTVSPDGKQLAFIRSGTPESSVEVMPLSGGAAGATVIARTRSPGALRWLGDGRVLLTEGDGLQARLLEPGGGASSTRTIRYCINPTLLADGATLLCGGGGNKQAEWSSLQNSAATGIFKTRERDSTFVFGSDFHVVDGKYLVYVSNGGDLLAAPVDLQAKTVGRSVRLVAGLGRDAYSGAGSFALSATGTLIYASGVNGAVGSLVRTDGRTSDTLRAGREPFLQFSMSPDGNRLAAVVERFDGHDLRIIDLRSGEYVVWKHDRTLRHPLWSPRGDRLVSSTKDSLIAGPPDATSPPRAAFSIRNIFEGFSWLPDGRLVATDWAAHAIEAVDLDRQPARFDTLATSAVMGRVSPAGARWLVYNSPEFDAVWIEPLPKTGQRFRAGTGIHPQWRTASEFVTSTNAGHFALTTVDGSVNPPRITSRAWFDAPRFVGIAGGSFSLTPDGRVIYKEGVDIEPARYLRVVPNWVVQMKRAVDEANR